MNKQMIEQKSEQKTAQIIRKRYLTAREAAEYIGVSYITFGNWKRQGKYQIPFVQFDTVTRYDINDLDAFMEARKTTPQSM